MGQIPFNTTNKILPTIFCICIYSESSEKEVSGNLSTMTMLLKNITVLP